MAGIEDSGDPLPGTLRQHPSYAAGSEGPLTTPVGGGFRSVNVRLREEFGLYANVRPVRTMVPGGRYEDIDIVLVRENIEGLYVAFEHYIPIGDDPHAVAISTGVNTRERMRARSSEFAFEYALKTRPQEGDRRAQGECPEGADRRVSRGRPRDCEEIRGPGRRWTIASSMPSRCNSCMNPWQFDVIVTTNLFGDILSDQLAGLVGGLGMAPGANIGPDAAIFEAVHGSAPDIAGKGIANPLALLLAVGLMLEHVDQPELANRLRTAIDQVLRKDGVRTPDLGGKASTGDFTQSIIRRLG